MNATAIPKTVSAVWKYEIPVEGEIEIVMPKGSKILSFQVQREKPCIWALVNPEEKLKQSYRFILVGTGHLIGSAIDSIIEYIGTVQMYHGDLILHLFLLPS